MLLLSAPGWRVPGWAQTMFTTYFAGCGLSLDDGIHRSLSPFRISGTEPKRAGKQQYEHSPLLLATIFAKYDL